jgi:hypothetical protein
MQKIIDRQKKSSSATYPADLFLASPKIMRLDSSDYPVQSCDYYPAKRYVESMQQKPIVTTKLCE